MPSSTLSSTAQRKVDSKYRKDQNEKAKANRIRKGAARLFEFMSGKKL